MTTLKEKNENFEHYFTRNPKSELKVYEIKIKGLDIDFSIYSASGLFSKNRLDLGTKVLIKNLIYEPGWTVLDYGCGYGIVGIYLKLKEPRLKVYAVDINKRAIAITKRNIKKFGFNDFVAIRSDSLKPLIEKGIKFDAIYLNPPMTAGFDVVEKMFKEAKEALKENGIFEVVVRTIKGGKKVEKILNELFGNVEVVGKGSGFRVFLARKN